MKKTLMITSLFTLSIFAIVLSCKKTSQPPTQAMLYLPQDCSGGPINVTVSGTTKTLTPITNGTIPECSGTNTATYTLAAGTYTYTASDSNGTWNDTFVVAANKCNKVAVKCMPIVGTAGNPRFNLQFTNHENVDLDLHVISPDGSEIYYGNPSGQGGSLDIDCYCSSCPNGPSENIFWENGTAPHGTYTFKVVYYGQCGSGGSTSSSFTLRVMQNATVVHTYTGTLSSTGSVSEIYTYTY